MIDFRFKDYNKDLGTRQLGKELRDRLIYILNNNKGEKIVLDFTGINIVSNAFADECLVKASEETTLPVFIKRTTFKNVNELAKENIALAFKRNYPDIKSIS